MGQRSKLVVLEFFKGELRTFLALVLLLLIFVGLGFAASPHDIIFDFGTGLSSEVYPGAISVRGGASIYPQTSNEGVTFGWATPYIAEQSSGSQVTDLLKTDSNPGAGDNIFKISGLADKYYTVTLLSGNFTNGITTKLTVNGASYIADSEPGVWKTLTFKVAAQNGSLDFNFKRYGTNLWAVNAIALTSSSTPPGDLTFDMAVQPSEHIVAAGGTAVYQISILPNNGYSSEVALSLADLPNGMSATFNPMSGVPPMVSNLEISTRSTNPITSYTLMVTAQGRDSGMYTVHGSISLVLTNEPVEPPANVPGVDLKTWQKQAATNQKFIDQYLTVEQKKLLNTQELMSLQELPATAAIEVMPDLPQPRSLMDASLRQLTSAGIIGMVVDSAPAVESALPPRIGFWGQFFGAMFNPAR